MLIAQTPLGLVVSMGKKVRLGFIEVAPSANIFNVRFRRWKEFSIGPAIRFDGRTAANFKPVIGLRLAIQKVQHHFFMIAKQRNELASFTQRKHFVNHLPAVRPAIDTVAQRDQRIIRLRLNDFDESAQRLCTSMDIANSDHALGHCKNAAKNWATKTA